MIPERVYLTQPEYIFHLSQELEGDREVHGPMVFAKSTQIPCFAEDIWLTPQICQFESITEAARILKAAGRFWRLLPLHQVRRSRLIEEQLRKCPSLLRHFPIQETLPEVGEFTLLDKNTMIFSQKRWKSWPSGQCFFIEDKTNPPNRAYLKLWEALSYLGHLPQPNDLVLDLGASPGGWTYVMHSLGANVIAVDKAPLAPTIAKRPRINYLQQSGFALEPQSLSLDFDWLLSDIACYPERAYMLILKWINSQRAKQLIVTIKLQGEINWPVLKQIQAIPDSLLTHLHYNKHELTFFYPAPSLLK